MDVPSNNKESQPLLMMENHQYSTPSVTDGPANNGVVQNNNNNTLSHSDDSPSYEVLWQHSLLTTKYRVASEADLILEPPNSTRIRNTILALVTCPFFCLGQLSHGFEVPNGSLKLGYNGRGDYVLFGPGVHQVLDPYYRVETHTLPITSQVIVNGDRTIVTVDQGFIGYCMELGQPILLPPGMHQWKSATLKFVTMIDLNQPVINLGPWTLLTIDQGYMAVTQDNGRQVILEGGSVYLLTRTYILYVWLGWLFRGLAIFVLIYSALDSFVFVVSHAFIISYTVTMFRSQSQV